MKSETANTPFVGLARQEPLGALLRLGPDSLSVYWANPSRGVFASGTGVAGEGGGAVQWLGSTPDSMPPGPWFGGWAFDAQRLWAGFDAERWILPEVLAWWDGRRSWLAAFGPAGTSPEVLQEKLTRVQEVEPATDELSSTVQVGSSQSWARRVNAALEMIEQGAFEKVVLARTIEVCSEGPLPERVILKALEARHPQCWTFLVRGRDGRAFVGATPELLCEGDGQLLSTEALAGTAAKGQGEMLLRSEKEKREHQLVVQGICAALEPFAVETHCPKTPVVKSLASVEHLHTPIRAQLKSGHTLLEVARALHPTPAVGGYPRVAALEWLKAHEGFDRGWYAGAVGARGEGTLTLAVALRSALLSERSAQVFVGAGLVEGSEPNAEWLETERKSRTMLTALGAHRG